RLGPYEIVAPLGSGGMGVVYRARDTRLGRDVALKVLPASLTTDADRLRRFENEARAAARLNHPNILQVFDVGQHEGHPYLVTELLKGQTLRERLADGPMGARRAVEFAIGVAQGLAAAHDEEIVHRDLKPENLFLTADGRAKILDFGLAKLTRPDDGGEGTIANARTLGADTAAGIVLGTVGYMSPEQVRGQTVDGRSDIFTFGAILYEMVSGKRAFHGDSPADTMSAILKEDPPELTVVVKDIPPVLDRIVHRCLEKVPARRFRSAQDLAFSLEAISTASSTAAGERTAAGDGGPGRRREVSFEAVTFSRGMICTARFAPDGQTIVYAAAWEGEPLRIFMKRAETPDPIPIAVPSADVMAISSKGEMAVKLNPQFAHAGVTRGMLAVAPLFGGAPRQIAENVTFADYDSASNGLLVVREVGGKSHIEYPLGTVLYESAGHVSYARLSPRGDRIAFLDHPLRIDDRSSIAVLDLQGKKTILTKEWATAEGMTWAPSGDEIWFTAADRGVSRTSIHAVSLSGQLRQVYAFAGGILLHDIAKDGNVLLSRDNIRCGILGKGPGETQERDLTWLDWSIPQAISADGKTLLFEEENQSVGRDYAVCIRGMNGSPVIRLGEGSARGLSRDGRWAAARTPHADAPLVLLPTG
ncbi:MAG TPA: serine/threonine-protein kinase, partial [Candidatus Eisenbacteria bacterium]